MELILNKSEMRGSQPGQGSTFQIFLPAIAAPIPPKPAPTLAPGTLLRGGETILVVEDEAHLRLGICRTLQALGYRVFEAADGPQALQVWEAHGAAFDLLLTDMVMPNGLTGLELGERLRARKPGLPMIISSGYSTEIVRAGGVHRHGVILLAKPYRIDTLAEALRTLLDRPASGPTGGARTDSSTAV